MGTISMSHIDYSTRLISCYHHAISLDKSNHRNCIKRHELTNPQAAKLVQGICGLDRATNKL